MNLLFRIVWAVAWGVVVWLICTFLGGFLALTHQPMLNYTGQFLVTWAMLIGVIAALFAFVGGAPSSLVTYFQRRPLPPPS